MKRVRCSSAGPFVVAVTIVRQLIVLSSIRAISHWQRLSFISGTGVWPGAGSAHTGIVHARHAMVMLVAGADYGFRNVLWHCTQPSRSPFVSFSMACWSFL